MSRNCNGYIRDSLDFYKKKKDAGGSSSEIEEILRHFQKEAVVLCERYDIKPYLLKMKMDVPPDLREPTFVAMHEIGKYQKKCSVRLRRENLEQLKEEFMNNLKRNIVYTTDFTCNICQKVYLSEEKLLNHLENKHVMCYKPENKVRKKVSFSDEIIVHEVKEYHRCRKCPKIYEDYASLKVHMKEVHKKRRCYICIYCSKDFIDRMFFKVHVKLHCDACGLLLPTRKRYLEHRRTVCKIVKKYVCKTCHISLFYFMDLKDHSYEHLGQFYICDICKDRFDDKCALSHHIKFLHSKRRPKTLYTTHTMGTDTVYVCKFCELSSARRDLIEKHVSTFPEYEKCAMTGYNDFYFCNQCFEKFSTETDMLQHKWSHFLKSAQQNVEELPKPVNLLNKMDVITDNIINNTQNNAEDNPEVLIDSTTQNTQTTDSQKSFKLVYNVKTEKLPPLLQPRIVLEKLPLPQDMLLKNLSAQKTNSTPVDFIDLTDSDPKTLKNPLVARRRTLLSEHQCKLCLRYFASKYTLKRHLYAKHGVTIDGNSYPLKLSAKGNLHCYACEEDFALPSLLKNHNCIRINLPEPPFQDARPDIQIDTTAFNQHNGFDDIEHNYDYMNSIDFEIPAPIVELTEYENVNLVINDNTTVNNGNQINGPLNNLSVNSRQLNSVAPISGPLNNLPVNNNRLFNGPLNNLPVNNDRRFSGQLHHVPLNDRQLSNVTVNNHRPLATMTVNNDRLLTNVTVNNDGQINGPLNNAQLSGKRLRYIYVQEVPIEF
ncbi:zinc finger protein Xfin-like isoform X2 [Maniola jurtina]|uniref:zinc finger protein Xfin-like isoform X2 n=1 Tax=Maniola jurtina TaxID=191418 RepID=UPI001E686615|nr:zinc finger protein Xfin-like isoform X2 [Maniola jurtina]